MKIEKVYLMKSKENFQSASANDQYSIIAYEDILKFHKDILNKVGLDEESNDDSNK